MIIISILWYLCGFFSILYALHIKADITRNDLAMIFVYAFIGPLGAILLLDDTKVIIKKAKRKRK